VTADVKYIVDRRGLVRNSHCLRVGFDSLYLKFKLTIWALN